MTMSAFGSDHQCTRPPLHPARARLVSSIILSLSAVALLAACSDDDNDKPSDVTIGVPAQGTANSFTEGVVTAANPLAAQAGANVLARGGNAIDAAIATQFVLNVVEPTSSGIGGGGFMGIYLAAEDRTFFIDSREKAPAAATPTMFLTCDPNCAGIVEPDTIGGFNERATSGIAVGVPGTLLGAAYALETYGSGLVSLADALAPAITLAADGFPINARLALLTADDRTTFWPETSSKFRQPGGEPLEEGFLLVQPDLAKTFRLIADGGVDAFYSGPVADAIVAAQSRSRTEVGVPGFGRMTTADLAAYRAAGVTERSAVTSQYRGFEISGMPSPSSGGNTVGQILACIEQFPIGNSRQGFGIGALNTLHVMAESMRLAFASRSIWMGDADSVDLPDEGLLAPGYLNPRCAQISTTTRIESPEADDPRPFDPDFASASAVTAAIAGEPEGVDTTHFTVSDAAGNVVTWTSTIEGTWGTGITVPDYGFLLNNELTDFNSEPQANNDPDNFAPGANDVAPGKRPRSSMAPTMVFRNDKLVAAYGSPGGSTIINTVVNMTVNLIDHGLDVQAAINAPRFHTSGGTILLEPGFAPEVLAGLEALGHRVAGGEGYEQGSVQAIVFDTNKDLQYGGADSRRAGSVVGLPIMQ